MKEGGSSCWFTRLFMKQNVENLNTSCMINKKTRALVCWYWLSLLLRFGAGLNPAYSLSEVFIRKELWHSSRLKIGLKLLSSVNQFTKAINHDIWTL